MRILLLGGSGMLGHELARAFRDRFDTAVTVRSARALPQTIKHHLKLLDGVDAFSLDTVIGAYVAHRPEVVVNCIGIVKQSTLAKDPIASLTINSLFPHRLANLCRAGNSRLIHISTDCVFAGTKGDYTEDDTPDAADLYGLSKLLGEVTGPGCLTLRTSIIGREVGSKQGLVEWFLSNVGGKVPGYEKAIFSGLTTRALGEIIATIIQQHPQLTGLYHVASRPINKLTLLKLLRDAYHLDIDVYACGDVVINRSLNADRFANATGITIPEWPDMIHRMAGETH